MNTETRRKSERTKVASNEIVYLHFQTANGAVALDVSTEGIGFQAADSLRLNEFLPFRLSVPGFPEIALSGEIVWLDSTRKRGGMRLSVPAESLALFQQWQRKYLDSAPEAGEIPAYAKPNEAVASRRVPGIQSKTENAPIARAAGSPEARPANSAPAPQPEPPRTSPPPPPNPFARRADSVLGARGPIFVSEWEAPPEPSRTGRNILVACVIIGLCVVIAGGSYYLAGKRAVGNMLINLGQQIGGASPQTSATAPQPASGAPSAPAALAPDTPPAVASLPANAPVPNSADNASSATNSNVPQAAAAPLPRQPQADADAANPTAASQAAVSPTAQQANANAAGAGASAAELGQADTHNGRPEAVAPSALDPHRHSGSASHPAFAQAPQPAADNGRADLNQALKYLQGSDSQDSAVAAQFLWSAIGEGNTQADLVLGDLYMRGQGAVHRNCRQAEILLHAALVADVPGASEKVDELQTYGCR